jgi:hypothetical protein
MSRVKTEKPFSELIAERLGAVAFGGFMITTSNASTGNIGPSRVTQEVSSSDSANCKLYLLN